MDFLSTVKGSLLENFYPKGWNLKKMDECCEKGVTREDFWHKDFTPVDHRELWKEVLDMPLYPFESNKWLKFSPITTKTDGFFMCVMKKVEV